MFGFQSMYGSDVSPSENLKPKLYHAMESDDDLNTGKSLDKGKGIDRSDTQTEEGTLDKETGMDCDSSDGENKPPLDKGKGIDRKIHRLYLKDETPIEPPFVT
jgi:hypothetical protein